MSGPGPLPRHDGSVVVVGSFMMDLVVRTSRRPQVGETVIGRSLDFFLGGKGFNQAVASARHGAATTMVGRLGADDFGAGFVAKMADEGIDSEHVGRDRDLGTGCAVPVVDDAGDNAIIIIPRANSACRPEHLEPAAPTIGGASVVLAQLELPFDTVAAALRLGRDGGAYTVLNPAPMSGSLAGFRGLVDLVTPNETEAAAIAGTDGGEPEQLAAAAAAALDCPAVLLTLGDKGCLLWDRGQVTRLDPHPVTVVDTVGAGDAVCGTVAAALASGATLADAARLGNAAGALAVTVAGAEPSMPRHDDVATLARGGPNS